MRSHRRFLASCALAATATIGPVWGSAPRRLVVVLRPAADRAVVRKVLARGGFRLESPLWADARSAVLTAAAVGTWDTTAAFATLSKLQRTGSLIGGGELLAKDRGSFRFYSGHVLVHFRGPIDEPGARAWGRPLDLAPLRRAGDGTWFLFDAPLDPASLLALTTHPPGAAIDVIPIVHDLSAARPPALRVGPAAYHRIPKDRNKLVVLLDHGPDDAYNNFLQAHGAVGVTTLNQFQQIVAFRDEAAMEAAQEDIGEAAAIRRAGPLLSEKPLAFLTNQLVVRFKSPLAVEQAEIVRRAHGVREVRPLSYVENGFLYQLEQPSYELYDIARELILEGHALYAVPNVATFAESACRTTECNDVAIPHLDYLRMINSCAVRTPPGVVLAILDEGIQADPSLMANDRLRVETAIDFKTMKACHPQDPFDWWSKTGECGPVFNPPSPAPPWQAAHGNRVALLAAADCDDGDLLGAAPAAPLINARLGDFGGGATPWTDVAFADALWWLGGGDPLWCRDGPNYPCTGTGSKGCTSSTPAICDEGELPPALEAAYRAGVINLSFVREDFVEQDCPDAGTCQLVCADPTQCGVIEGVLERIRTPKAGDGVRDGGAVVVAAAGIEGTLASKVCYDAPNHMSNDPGNPMTDLAESPWTVAVGSVQITGEPFFPDGGNECFINNQGGFLDVVAPMGGQCTLCTNCGPGPLVFGASSAATAVVSGVVTQMLEKNPQLTAAEAHCILRETANTFHMLGEIWDPGHMAGWKIPACPFDASRHSDCLGRGMLDAGAAVAAAVECANPMSMACPCRPPLPPTDLHRTDVDMSMEMTAIRARVPPMWGALRACIESGTCRCATLGYCFVRASIRNRLHAHVPATTFQICGDGQCRPLERTPRDWAPGGVLVARLEMNPEFLQWARARTGPLELRVWSGGKELTKRRLADLRKGLR